MKPHLRILLPLLSLMMAGLAPLTAAVPPLLNYQAHVTNAGGGLIGSGTPVNRIVHFRFWNSPSASAKPANLLYSEAQTVTINESNFSVLLGQGAPIAGDNSQFASLADAFGAADVFLGITVDNGDSNLANDTEITPRQQLVTTAFAFRSKVAERVDNLAITNAMLAASAVQTTNIAAQAVTNNALAADSVTGAKIAAGTIEDTDLASNSVTTDKLNADAVTGAKILDGTIGTLDLGNFVVTNTKLAANAVDSAKIADNSVALADLVDAVKQALCPPGTIVAYGGTTAPAGWLMCDGSQYSTGSFPGLYNVIGSAFGISGSFFRVPDFRGKFLRGRAAGQIYDPDRNSRGVFYSGGASGDAVGSYQADQFRSHTHKWLFGTEGDDSGGGGSHNEYTRTPGSSTDSIEASGGSETRPVNIYVNYIIKH